MSPVPGALTPDLLLAAPQGIEERRRLAGKDPLKVAREFEAILVAQMLAAMRKTVPESGLLQASAAHRMLDGAFDQEVARSLAPRAHLGIARQLLGQIERRNSGTGHQPPRTTGAGLGAPRGAGPRAPAAAGETTGTYAAATRAGATLAIPRGHPYTAHARGTSAVRAPAIVAPVDGHVTSSFGSRRDPITGAMEFHAGVDLAAPRGAAVRAVAAGEVVFSGRRGASGNVVEVRHPGQLVTTYAHVARSLVHRGQKVAAGDVVATVGSTGRTTGPHLHFAVHRGGQLVDPTQVLGRLAPAVRTAEELAANQPGARSVISTPPRR